MAVDILLWIEGITKISTAMSKVLEKVNTLRLSWRVKKDKIEDVKKDIENISEKVGYLKMIGGILDEYIDYYIGSRILFTNADKLTELINRYKTDLSDKTSEFYNMYWEAIEVAFKDIKETKSRYINVILQRINYFDAKDAEQINIYVTNFNSNYDKAQVYLRERNVYELKRTVDDMSEQSLNLYRIFEDSIKNMTNGLRNV